MLHDDCFGYNDVTVMLILVNNDAVSQYNTVMCSVICIELSFSELQMIRNIS